MQTAATMEIQKERERLDNLQQIYEIVQTFCEEKKYLYLTTLQHNIQTQFPSVTGEEVQVLLYRYGDMQGLAHSFTQKLLQNWNLVKERMPEKVKDVLQMNMNKKSEDYKYRKEYASYQEALKLPKDYTDPATLHKMFFPTKKKNTLLALQVINRLAAEYKIRFEDVETVLKECLIV